MGELPRITRALRAHTQLDPYKGLSPRKKQNKRRICKIKSHKGYKTLDDIRRYIKRHETNAEQLLIILEDIRTACTKLTTGEDDHDILDDATVVVLRMFLDQRMCMIQHTHSLKMLFGAVTNSISNGLYEAVKKISVKLSDETKAYIKEEKVVQPTEDPWGSNIECMFSVTKPEKKKKFKLYEPPATESKFVTEFSMAYTGPSTSGKTEATTNGKKKSDKTKTSNAKEKNKGKKKVPETTKPQTRPEFCQEWFERKAAQCRIPGILQPLLDLIHSKRSNEDIQNDLFDLLGYEHIDFIQDLLMHRQELVSDLLRPRTPPPPTLAEMQAQLPENKMPQYLCQVSVLSEHERKLAKLVNKEEKKEKKAKKAVENNNKEELYGFNVAELRARIKPVVKPTLPFSLKKLKDSDPILQRISYSQTKVQYPNVYDMSLQAKTSAGYLLGTKMMLPQDIIRKNTNEYEEVILPKNDPPPLEVGNQRVAISSLDEMGQMAFENIKELNRIQSVVFPTAYNTNENLLICAPTGAGKTNIALLTVVHQIKQYTENQIIQKNKFKIIYIAPMKALASEMTASFGKRLRGLGIAVRELTGDMKLSKFEVSQTQMIVTTPEKWDVVTRKGATDIELSALVKLIIIDEVHLLHGDRGPVVESIVARTLRQVESSQNMIRIVGLSATLPNYLDVARFLRVNPNVGLFFFDGRFRPVPLEQQFIGVKETNNTKSHLDKVQAMNQICYDKAIEELRHGNQVMIFVHSRNATQNLATVIKSTAQIKNDLKHFEPDQTAAYLKAKKAISSSRNNELQQLFVCGIAIHHAGMLRSDRNMVEKYFTEGFIKVLVSTSTLAWGVNLPAHCVIIRGTDIYDENRGAMVDLSILDVLQIFGRAGRPQFDTSGVGIIITLHDKLSHYLTSMTNQFPIESNFISHLADNLNAEIALGTVSDVSEAVEWLSYTYLFVRMRINPQAYGLNYYDVQCDPTLEAKRLEVITAAAMRLDKAQMIRFNDITGELHTTDLGRTASHFYITCVTMERFNAKVRKLMSEGQIIDMLSNCSDFEQIKVRKEEISELRTLQKRHCQLKIGSRSEDLHWKISVLLQTYLSRGQITSFSLISDLNYMIQNAVRVIRALFEITLRKNNAYMAAMYLKLAHMMELQTWDFCSVMRQFNCFSAEVLRHIENPLLRIDQLRDMDEKSLGALVRNPSAAKHLKKCADEFPLLEMDASLHPISRTILRIRLYITPNFRWSDKHHGKSEAFWVWVEDPESDIMYYHEFFVLTKKQVISREPQEMIITIPILEPMPPQYYIRATSEKWLGSESVLPLTFHHLILPESHPPHTEVLYLRPLPKKALRNPEYEALYPFSHFNPIQTQIFHCLYYSDVNVLLGASTGSGKTIAAEITMFRSFNVYPQCKVVYIAPLKALVKERMKDWKIRMEQKLCKRVVELTGDVSPDVRAIKSADIIVTTPEKWDGISRSWQTRSYVQDVALIIMDEIHMLGEDRGPVLEVIVSRAKFIEHHSSRKIRIVGLSTALANACDLADWLGIKEKGVFNFRPSVRPVALRIHIAGFPGRHYCPRMMTMNKPTFQAIKTHSPNKPVLVFVSSRRQTRLTGQDLIAYLAAEENPKQWLNMDESALEQVLSGIKDSNLKLMLAFGVGLHHAGLHEKDRTTVEELFVNRKIQVLICTATLSWGVNFPAHLVVIKGTEYFDTKQKRYVDMPITDVMQMMGRAGRPQYDINGEVVLLVHDQKKNFYRKFLYEPFPVESSLLEVLPDHVNAEIVAGTVQSIPDILDYMTWTFFYRRLMKNPTYYNLESLEEDDINNYMTTLITGAVEVLERANCVELGPDGLSVQTTWMGRIASYYYLSHKTMAHFNVNLYHNITADELMWTLAHCEEYSGLPVRHNEDVLNGELSQTCRIRVDPLTLDSAHTKALLLLQAHLSRAPLPNADYLTDTKSVLDQTIRILQAMIDATAENGWLNACLLCQQLMQSIIQARWPTDSPLTTLPYVNSRHLYLFTKMAKETKKPCTMLNGLKIACLKSHEWLAKYLRKEFDEMDIEMIATVLRELPTLDVDVSVRGLWLNSQTDEERPVNKRPKKGQWIPLHAGQEYDLSLNMRRRGGKGPVFCPYFPRAKNENWFVTLGCIEYGELLALKRVAGRGRANIRFVAPDQKGRVIYTLYILSDSYMGLDQQYSFQFEILDPLPPDTFDRAYGQLVQGDKASA